MWSYRRDATGLIVTGNASELRVRLASPARAARAYLSRDGLVVAACGPMFAFDSNGRLRPLGAMIDRTADVQLVSTQPNHGASVFVVDGVAGFSVGVPPAQATVAVQGYPTLIQDGRVIVTGQHDRESTARVAIGVDMGGHVVIAAAASVSMLAFAQWLATFVRQAVYLDGGSAAELVSADGSLSFGSLHSLPSVVGFVSSSTGGTSTGGSDQGAALLLLLLLAAAKRRR